MKREIVFLALLLVFAVLQLSSLPSRAADRKYYSYPATTFCNTSSRILIYEIMGNVSASKTITCKALKAALQ